MQRVNMKTSQHTKFTTDSAYSYSVLLNLGLETTDSMIGPATMKGYFMIVYIFHPSSKVVHTNCDTFLSKVSIKLFVFGVIYTCTVPTNLMGLSSLVCKISPSGENCTKSPHWLREVLI